MFRSKAARSRRSQLDATSGIRGRCGAQPRVESLEGRVVMTAATALDPSFGQRGLLLGAVAVGSPNFLVQPSAVAVQPDGKIVEVGTARPDGTNPASTRLFVRRLDVDGSPDATFGTGGQVTVPAPNATSYAFASPRDVTVLADGSILFLASFTDTAAAVQDFYPNTVVKVTAAGALDATFGAGGEAPLPAASGRAFPNLIVQPDGRIVVTNSAEITGAGDNVTYAFTLTRYSAAGVLDATFGTGGVVALKPPQSDAPGEYSRVFNAGAVALPGGQILLAGNTTAPAGADPGSPRNILARVNPDGTLDAGFGTGGFATLGTATPNDFLIAVAAQPDGKVLLAGQDFGGVGGSAFLTRILPDGSVDPSFAASPVGLPNKIVVGADGTVTIAGVVQVGSAKSPVFVQRFEADGGTDLAFGTRGRIIYRLNSALQDAAPGTFQASNLNGLALAAGGSVVVASTVFNGNSTQGAIARLLPVAVRPAAGDYDGDGTSDIAVLLPNARFAYRTPAGDTIVDLARGGTGLATLPAAGDYDGDGKADPAAYLTDSGVLRYRGSDNHPNAYVFFGPAGAGQAIPAPGDYNGDGRDDVVAYLPGRGEFALRTDTVGNPGDVFVPFGIAGAGQTIPAPGDYDGDGKADVAAYLPCLGLLAYRPSSGGPDVLTSFGAVGVGGSIPAPGDYDGDGRTDLAVYLPQYAVFAYRPSSGGADVLQAFGAPGAGVTAPAASIPYAQPPTVSARALAVAPGDPGVALPLTDDLLATLAGKPKRRA